MSEFIKKCDDDDHLITDVDDRISFNDDEDLDVIMTDDIDIEEKLEEIENLRMFTGIIIIIIITTTNITIITIITIYHYHHQKTIEQISYEI